jgi:5'-methylthioadenosine phosphorylase
MGRLAVVLGSGAIGPGGEAVAAAVAESGAHALQRHDPDGSGFRLPHRIDHAANLRALREAGCDRVLGLGSVGSLKQGIGVGSLVCPDDFIALQLGLTSFDDARGHRPPGFDTEWRARLLEASGAIGGLLDGGTYWETIGPRFETPAEIRLLAAHADLVGMTIASECVIAGELELPYAALCMVDNLANGIAERPLSVAELVADREANARRLAEALAVLLPGIA